MRRIAAAAGVAPMGVYNHFESKSGIVEALFIQGFERLARRHGLHRRDRTIPYEALREGGRRYRALALAHPMVYQMMFLRAVPGFEPSDARRSKCAAGPSTAWSPPSSGPWPPASSPRRRPTETAQLIWASIHGWVSLELLGIGFVEDQEAGYDRLCTALLLGLRP